MRTCTRIHGPKIIAWFVLSSAAVSAWLAGCGGSETAESRDDAGTSVGTSEDSGSTNHPGVDAGTIDDAGSDRSNGDASIDGGADKKFVGSPTITTHGGIDNFVLARSADGRTWFKKPGAPGPEWSDWLEVPSLATLGESPDLAAWSNDRLDVIASGPCGPNGAVHACQAFATRNVANGTITWSGVYDLGGPGSWQGSLALSSPQASRLAAQGIGTDGNLYDSFWNGGAWSAWAGSPTHPTLVGSVDTASRQVDLDTIHRLVTVSVASTSTEGVAFVFGARNLDGSQFAWSSYSTPTPPEALTGDPTLLRRTDLDRFVAYVRAKSGRLLRVAVALDIQTAAITFGSWREVALPGGLSSVLHVDCATNAFSTIDVDHCVALGSDGAVWTFKTNASAEPPAGPISATWTSLGTPP